MANLKKFSWRCPKCEKRNKWEWEEWNFHPGPITMHCDRCNGDTKMFQDGMGNVASIEKIEDERPTRGKTAGKK